MNRIPFLFAILVCISCSTKAQNNAQLFAAKVADHMKDTLQLTPGQRNTVYNINLQLAERKTAVRQQFQHPDSIRNHMQGVEYSRDSLYRSVLDDTQFLLYKKRKIILLKK